MRLSEAIRLGSLTIKPIPYKISDGNGGGCALGMAQVAIGTSLLRNEWPWMTERFINVPCSCVSYKQHDYIDKVSFFPIRINGDIVVHLFNEHVMEIGDWTLDKLCEWIASVEPKEAESEAVSEPETYGAIAETVPTLVAA